MVRRPRTRLRLSSSHGQWRRQLPYTTVVHRRTCSEARMSLSIGRANAVGPNGPPDVNKERRCGLSFPKEDGKSQTKETHRSFIPGLQPAKNCRIEIDKHRSAEFS